MSPTKRLVAIGVLLLSGFVLVRWYKSDERRINRNIGRIEKLVAKAPGEDNLTALGKARGLTELFAESFEFQAEQFNFATRDRQQLAAAVHQYRSRSQAIAVEIRERDLSVSAEQGRATSHLTVVFMTRFQDISGTEAYRFQINWIEKEGDWLIDYVNLLEIIPDASSRPF